jgi:hypothetical protein
MSRQYLEDSLKEFGSVIIHTNKTVKGAQIIKETFENKPKMAQDLIDLIYNQVTGPDEYITMIEPNLES